MGSTNADVEKVLVDEPIQNEANYQSNPSDPVAEKEPEPEFDTGLRTWLQVVGSFFLFFNSWGIINTWGAYQTYYEQELLAGTSSSTIAWIGSLQSFLLMMIGVITGPLFDAGYFRTLISFAAFLLPFGLMMTSLATKYWQLILSQGVCIGLAAGCLFVPSVAILPQYFRAKRGLANGFAASGSSIGGVVYPIMFDQLQKKVGFAWATRALGFVCFGTTCISVSIMRQRFQPKEKRKLFQFSVLKEPAFTIFAIAMFMGFLGFYNFLFYVQSYAIETGIVDSNLGFYLLSMLNAASTFGRIAPNFLADHIGPLNMLTPAVTITAILAFVWIRVHTVPGIIILSVFYGFFSGGFVSLPPVVMASMTPDVRNLGTRMGMLFAIVSIGLLIGTPIGGAILNSTNEFVGVQLFTACCLITSAVLMTVVRLLRTGPKLRVKA
ncbi:unnamed protein product [Penicillium salamii]|uniref:Major facilitator superfamily (MFS) profile domain-containing protein n=1 Tax=Penicillium salamii TaxID=1612424 RepID=A0A9W4NAT1_9EURO|nr:unnamed protein product [Penicillium salamii]CAG8223567.1 unnamed protein product [Penicillium salamii]CAG8315057.1 unnamed protein product [Penicillium salamii]CAG8392944.1 unnamed protein product [Penicillium salamii]CAG8395186.1 unnamed protein product [Penicillium salamii]